LVAKNILRLKHENPFISAREIRDQLVDLRIFPSQGSVSLSTIEKLLENQEEHVQNFQQVEKTSRQNAQAAGILVPLALKSRNNDDKQ